MRITKEQLKKIIKEEMENLDEGPAALASKVKAIQGTLKDIGQRLNIQDEQFDHIINKVLPNLIKNMVMTRE